MKKIFALSSLLLVLAAPAFAGLDLAWNDCATSPNGVADIVLDCDGSQSLGQHTLFGNFQTSTALPQFLAMDFVIDVQTAADPLPTFWQFAAGECNDGNLALRVNRGTKCFQGTQASAIPCAASGGQCLSGGLWTSGFGASNRARFNGSIFRDATAPVALSADVNYFCLAIDIFTFGASELGGSCDGCTGEFAIVFNSLLLSGLSAGVGTEAQEVPVSGPGLGPNGGCASGNSGTGICGATPTQARTWGQVKSLYR